MKYIYLSILTFVLFGLSISQNWAQSEQPILTIGCLSDLHCESTNLSSPVKLKTSVTTTLSKMKTQENLDIILLGGDLTSQNDVSQSVWNEHRDTLTNALVRAFNGKTAKLSGAASATPLIITTGNHEFQACGAPNSTYNSADYYTYPMSTLTGTLDSTTTSNVSASPNECFYETLGKTKLQHVAAYHYQINGIDFIGINTSNYNFNKDTKGSGWTYSTAQANWVKAKLEKIMSNDPKKLVFVVEHFMFDGTNKTNGDHVMPNTEATKTLKSTYAKYPNLIMLYGHDHSGDVYISSKTSERVTRYNTSGTKISTTDKNHVDGTVQGTGNVTANSSFMSCFMGSMNYRQHGNLYQALMIYVYKDRIVFQTKNFNESKESDINKIQPYTFFYTDTTPGTEPEPESGSFLIKNNANGTYLNASSDGLSLSSTKQGWDITSLGSNLFRVLTTSGGSSYNLCGMSSSSNIRVTSDHTTSEDKKYNCYFYEIADPNASTVVGTLASEISAGKYYFIDTQYSSTHYILGNTAGTKGSDGTTLKGQSASPSSNKISRSKSDAANYIYYIESPITYNYFGKITATATTGGQVIVDANPTASSDFAAESVKSWGAETNSEEKTWYFHAQANSGYDFMAWAEDEAGKKAVSKNEDFSVKVTATSDDKSNPTAKQYYAIFRKVESGATSSDGYYLKNVGNDNYLDGTPSSTKNEAKFAFSSTEQVWNIEPSTDNYFRITLTKNGVTSNIYHGYYNSSNYKFKLYNMPTEDGWKYNCFLYKINETDIEKSSITATKVTDSKITSGYYFIGSTNNDDNHSNLTVNIMGNETSTSSKLVALSKENMSSSKESDATITVSVSDIKNYIYQIITPEPAPIEVTVSSAGYATYCSDKDLVVPADETVFGAKSKDDVVSLLPVKKGFVIKAKQGFIIKAKQGKVTFNISENEGEVIPGNELVGTTEYQQFDQGTIYLLGQNEGNVAFMLNSTEHLLAPNKAYLPKYEEAKTKQVLYISDDIDDATAINRMSGNLSNAKMYNLNGMRVNKNYKGLIIKNGKKFLLK